MAPMGRHNSETPVTDVKHNDHLWVLVLIAASALLEVWASWLVIGSVSGFPKIGKMSTGWILPVTTEAYWAYALFAWLARPAGPRSRSFAKWSAAAMFALSLCGQESGHLLAAARRPVPPTAVVMLVTALPLIALALIAILVHLRQKDREEAARVARVIAREAEVRAEAAQADDERVALRAQLEEAQDILRAETGALRAALKAAETAREEAANQAAEATAQAEALARKLDAQRARNTATKKRATEPRKTVPADRATEVPDDVDARREALAILANEPGISGAKLGPRVGKSARWGQLYKQELAGTAPRDVVDSEGGGSSGARP